MRPKVSLCMIVKNEEANLPSSLGALVDLVDECIVVDTGSTDRTREIAQQLGALVHEFPWCDDFSAARNETLRYATGEWILWFDADDRIDAENRERLRRVLAGLGNENLLYMMRCVCPPDPDSPFATIGDHPRLFRKHPQVRWQHRVHEQIVPAILAQGGDLRFTDVTIEHSGYQNAELSRAKDARNVRLMELELQEQPDDPWTRFNLGQTLFALGRNAEAIDHLQRALAGCRPTETFVFRVHLLLSQLYAGQGRHAEALAICRQGRERFPEQVELAQEEALQLARMKDLPGAEAVLLQVLEMSGPERRFAGLDQATQRIQARYNLSIVYRDQGRVAESEAALRTVLAERPEYALARVALAELLLRQERWAELEQTLETLSNDPRHFVQAAVLRSQIHRQRRDFATSRQWLEQAIAAAPRALMPRVAMSHLLLEEGRDLLAAERAVLDVLALAPDNANALYNLSLLRQQRAGPPLLGGSIIVHGS
jgi:tetratricopeptide (TPR) repeat protein